MKENWQPILLKISSFTIWRKNTTQPQEHEALMEFESLFNNEKPSTFKELREIADDHGLALVEVTRNPVQDPKLDSYRLIKKVDDNGEDIDLNLLHQNIDKYTVATINLRKP